MNDDDKVVEQVPPVVGIDIRMVSIGTVDDRDNGRDEYVLLTRLDDNTLTPEQAIDWLLPRVYRRCYQPGGYFCTTVRAVNAQYRTDVCICTVEHRYDI